MFDYTWTHVYTSELHGLSLHCILCETCVSGGYIDNYMSTNGYRMADTNISYYSYPEIDGSICIIKLSSLVLHNHHKRLERWLSRDKPVKL